LWYKDGTTQESFSDNTQNGYLYEGDVIQGDLWSGGTPTLYDLVYLRDDGTWASVVQTTNSSTKMLGVYVEGTGEMIGAILLEGHLQIEDTNNDVETYVNGVDHGLPIYIRSASTGVMSTTVPTSDYVRIMGHAYYRNTTDTTIWTMRFDPDNTWIKI
jgi:hypothetical protein